MPTFDLLDEPWIPCMDSNGATRSVGMATALTEAHRLREIADPSPLVTAALHRLLLAVLHRVFGPADTRSWATLWERRRSGWDEVALGGYLDTRRSRFDLFHSEHPFYQVATLGPEDARPVLLLAPRGSADSAAHFDHASLVSDHAVDAGTAARLLVAHQAFALGGLVSLAQGEDPKRFKSADAAPLARAAVVLIRGGTLFETLMLNLHRYDPSVGVPFAGEGGDRPAWEANPPRVEERRLRGYLDLLTWQSRRVRLLPEDGPGGTVVRQAVAMKGDQFPKGYQRRAYETMLAFRSRKDAKSAAEAWPAIEFVPDKAVWRDSHALIQAADDRHEPPKLLTWLGSLVDKEIVGQASTEQLELFGLASDQASARFWRHERLPLPLAYLANKELADAVGEAVRLAEAVAKRAVQPALKTLATYLLASGADRKGGRAPRKKDVTPMVGRFGVERGYWAHLEGLFKRFLVDLADAWSREGTVGADAALDAWRATLRRTARGALRAVAGGLDPSGQFKALARAEDRLEYGLVVVLDRASGEPDLAAGAAALDEQEDDDDRAT